MNVSYRVDFLTNVRLTERAQLNFENGCFNRDFHLY
jgi:hypothetical protein